MNTTPYLRFIPSDKLLVDRERFRAITKRKDIPLRDRQAFIGLCAQITRLLRDRNDDPEYAELRPKHEATSRARLWRNRGKRLLYQHTYRSRPPTEV